MITKEELLEKLLETRIGDKHRAVLKLALKGLEHEKIEGQEFIPLGEHLLVVGGLSRSRNLWRKKHDELADELDDKIIALEEKLKNTISLKYHNAIVDSANQIIVPLRNERDALKEELKAKDADLAVASKIIDDARAKRRALEIQTDHLRNGRLQAEDQIAVLEDKLRDTVTLKYHDAIVDSANQIIVPLRNERNAFQRLVGELEIEKSCIRADLENVCKERDDLKGKIDELETELGSKDDDWRLSVSYYMNLAAVWEKRAEEMRAKLKKFEDFFTSED